VTAVELLDRVERSERRVAELYGLLHRRHDWDPEVAALLQRMQREEQVHVKLVQHGVRLARSAPALFVAGAHHEGPILACCRRVETLRLPERCSADEALALALQVEDAMSEALLCVRLGEAFPILAGLLEGLQEPAHTAGLLELASRRGLRPALPSF